MGSSLTAKITLAILAILACSLTLTAFLNLYKYEKTYLQLAQSRFGFVVFDIKATVENSLNLGLPLSALRNTQNVIERETAQDDQILSIEVFDQDGETQFSTNRGGIGNRVPRHWLAARGDGDAWSEIDDQAIVVGAPLINNFGQTVGGIALRYSRAHFDLKVWDMQLELMRVAIGIFAAAGIVAAVGVYLLFRSARRRLAQMEMSLRRIAESPTPAFDRAEAATDLERSVARFELKAREAIETIAAADREVDRIDRTA